MFGKILDKTPLIVLVLCSIIGVAVVPTIFRGGTEYFVNSILPEIVGFCLEGIMFVGVLGAIERLNERRHSKWLSSSLDCELSFLSEVMKNCILHSSLPAYGASFDTSSNASMARDLEQIRINAQNLRIKAGTTHSTAPDPFSVLAQSVANSVQKKSIVHLRRLESVTPVAAQLGGNYLRDWLHVTDRLYDLTRKERMKRQTIQSFGRKVVYEYAYSRLVDLFKVLDKMNVPPYNSSTC